MAGALLMFVLLIMFYIVIADIITIFFRLAGFLFFPVRLAGGCVPRVRAEPDWAEDRFRRWGSGRRWRVAVLPAGLRCRVGRSARSDS